MCDKMECLYPMLKNTKKEDNIYTVSVKVHKKYGYYIAYFLQIRMLGRQFHCA